MFTDSNKIVNDFFNVINDITGFKERLLSVKTKVFFDEDQCEFRITFTNKNKELVHQLIILDCDVGYESYLDAPFYFTFDLDVEDKWMQEQLTDMINYAIIEEDYNEYTRNNNE